jgi:hypothetical protein
MRAVPMSSAMALDADEGETRAWFMHEEASTLKKASGVLGSLLTF